MKLHTGVGFKFEATLKRGGKVITRPDGSKIVLGGEIIDKRVISNIKENHTLSKAVSEGIKLGIQDIMEEL